MQRNDLITLLAEKDNDTVTVSIRGFLIDIASVTNAHGRIVLILDSEETGCALRQIAAGDPGSGEISPA